ncbi:hypothetical protein [Actinomadura nitritigenes]|uniref:hypothetical protein n=1 Tax=Actinomadura nitritigenes TaxID=134602 RepID=UPI003D8E7A98
MTRISDWPPLLDSATTRTVTADDEARLWDQGAEEALDQAVDIAGTHRDGAEYALIGIGMALRANGARMESLTDQLSAIADALIDLQATRRAKPQPRRRWWQRLADRFTRPAVTAPTCDDAGEACPDDGQLVTGPADSGATVTPLRRTEARS